MHTPQIKAKAVALRKAGYSYSDIQKRTGISQATLSDWLSGAPYTPNNSVKKKITRARVAAKRAVQRRIINEEGYARIDAAQIMKTVTHKELFYLGLGLYLGEGDKGGRHVAISNSEPDILLCGLRWMLLLPGITRGNIAVRVHIYPDLDERTVKAFWAKKLGIPLSQFGACVVDKRAKKMKPRARKLFFGTAHLIIRARGNPKHGVYLARIVRHMLTLAHTQA